MPKPSPPIFMKFIADVAIGVPPASFSSANKTSGRSRRSQPPAARPRQPPVSTRTKPRTTIHISSPTANIFSTSPVSCLNQTESNWECLANPNKMESTSPPGVVPRFASDHLLFVRAGHIQAQPFNPRTFKLSGDPQTIGEARTFSVSQNGVLAYHESSAQSELKVFDRSGNLIGTPGPLAVYSDPRFSPDGKSIAVTIQDPRSGTDDIWVRSRRRRPAHPHHLRTRRLLAGVVARWKANSLRRP